MKILTEKQILVIEREFMWKMYVTVSDVYRREKIEKSHHEILDIVLTHFHSPYSGNSCYEYHNKGDFGGFLPK